jgi:hypothetical protein
MMKTIFDCETEVGVCDYQIEEDFGFQYAEPDLSAVCASTVASLNGHRGLMKIEQQCYMRCGEELQHQPWIPQEVMFEPALSTNEEMVELAKVLHEQFVQRVRNRLHEQHLV